MQYKGIKKAVGDAQQIERNAKKDDSWYYHIMVDFSNGEVWTDWFYSLGHNEWKVYHSKMICTVYGYEKPTMKEVKKAINRRVVELWQDGYITAEEKIKLRVED